MAAIWLILSLIVPTSFAPAFAQDGQQGGKALIIVSPQVGTDASTDMDNGAEYQSHFQVDLLLGPLSGFRALFFPTPEKSGFALEGRYGGGFSSVGSVDYAGGGIRLMLNLTPERRNAWLVSPGVDVLVAFADEDRSGWFDGPYTDVYFVTPGVDVTYARNFAKRFGWQVGGHAAVGWAVSGQDNGNRPAKGKRTPDVSVFAGVRF